MYVQTAATAGGMSSLFLHMFGGIDSFSPESMLFKIIIKGVPAIFFLYLFGSYLRQDFKISFVYVFTRMNQRQKWLNRKIICLGVQFFLAWLILFLLTYLLGLTFGLEQNASLSFLLVLLLTNCLPLFVLCLIQNILALWLGSTTPFLMVLLFYTLSLVVGILTASLPVGGTFLFYLLPSVNSMYLWHENLFSVVAEEYLGQISVPGFVFWKSLLSCVVWFCGTYGAALYKINRCDLLEIGKEG